jgi:uncharacterized hydrophobic protein (TIGR00271 family)
LGFSLSLALVLSTLGPIVFRTAGEQAPIAYALGTVLFLPIVLSYAELAAGRPGSASPYQMARAYGSPWRLFVVGWMMLGGLVAVSALLAAAVGQSLSAVLDQLAGLQLNTVWFFVAVVGLAALNEALSTADRWRSRTVLVWTIVAAYVALVARALTSHPAGEAEFPRFQFEGHQLAVIAYLAAGLWAVDLLLNHRRFLRRPDATLRSALLIVWLGTATLGAASAFAVVRSPDLRMEHWLSRLSWGESRLNLLILLMTIILCWLGLSRLTSRTMRLLEAMSRQGFLPRESELETTRRGPALMPLLGFVLLVVLVAWRAQMLHLAGIAALAFLWVTALVMFSHARRPGRELSPTRRNRLPLHPLFPGVSAAGSLFLSLILPLPTLPIGLAWLLIGGLVYVVYERERSAEMRQRLATVGMERDDKEKDSPRVLVSAADEGSLRSAVSLGEVIARARKAELLVLRVMPSADELAIQTLQHRAQKEWQELDEQLERLPEGEVLRQPLVRIAPSLEAGILATASEYDADILLLGLGADEPTGPAGGESIVSQVLSVTSRPLVVLRGAAPDEINSVLVATGGGPHAPLALTLGKELAETSGGELELVSVVHRSRPTQDGMEMVQRTLEKSELTGQVASRVIEADSIEGGLLQEAKGEDLLVVGASVDRLLNRTVFSGLPGDVARARAGATLIVKRAEAALHFWQRRFWELVSMPLPDLSLRERTEVYSQMRHASRASADFYVLISLASAIAILGLLLDSGAVIIGAMLVAPLMSPILGLAQGVIQGNLHLIQRASASTFKGTAVSIAVATAVTLTLPGREATSEILARVQPNLLDLGVALAAGAAAAYAVSRKSVAAALPGVAISVALVPPLCVVGYGLGSSQFGFAGGALLLFLTNLGGIVLVGSIVFLLLGFRPARAERGERVRRAFVLAFTGLVLLMVPLGFTTLREAKQSRIETRINQLLEELSGDWFRVDSYTLRREAGVYMLEGTIYAFRQLELQDLESFRGRLEAQLGVPIRIQATIVAASFRETAETVEVGEAQELPVVPFGE